MDTETGKPLNLNNHIVTSQSQMPGGHQHVPDASNSDYILIQTRENLTFETLGALASLGVTVCERLGSNTLLCHYLPADLDSIRQQPYIVYANVLHTDLKLTKNLHEAIGNGNRGAGEDTDEAHDVYVVLHTTSDWNSARLMEHVVTNMGVSQEQVRRDGLDLRARLRPDKIMQLLGVDAVKKIEAVAEMELYSNLARQILGVPSDDEPAANNISDSVASMTSSSSSTPSTASTGAVINGKDEIIVVCDSGFDTGDPSTYEVPAAFRDRILPAIDMKLVSRNSKNFCADLAGHGTHVAGCALGDITIAPADVDESQLGTNFDTRSLTGRIKGIAPGASLVPQCVFDPPVKAATWIRPSDDQRFPIPDNRQTYGTGLVGSREFRRSFYVEAYKYPVQPRIHCNSWGATPRTETAGLKGKDSEDIDSFVRQQPDFLVVRGAGNYADNEWSADDHIFNVGAVKNGLTVGACYSTRECDFAGRFDAKGHKGIPVDVARFSARGPIATCPGILKPDLVAPGTAIYSHNSSVSVRGNGNSPVKVMKFAIGTSQSAPMVAGAAALVRHALRYSQKQIPGKTPSAALLKALLINCAQDLALQGGRLAAGIPKSTATDWTRKDSGSGAPAVFLSGAHGNAQGWGRLDVHASVANASLAKGFGWYDSIQHEHGSFTLPLGTTTKDLKPGMILPKAHIVPIPISADDEETTITATLVWTDHQGPVLANQLELSLKLDDEANHFVVDKRIASNNVQRLSRVLNDHTAEVRIVVTVIALLDDPLHVEPVPQQDYAVAWRTTLQPKGTAAGLKEKLDLRLAQQKAHAKQKGPKTEQKGNEG